jgi:hypothetical protein
MSQSTRPEPNEFPAETIAAAHRQATIITGAIGASLAVYAVLVLVLKNALPAPPATPGLDSVRIVLFAVVGAAIFMTTVIKGIMLRTVPPTGAARLAKLRTAAVLTAAFAELPAIIGLVLFLLGRREMDFFMLMVVSAYMLARHFPRLPAWENYVRRGNAVR